MTLIACIIAILQLQDYKNTLFDRNAQYRKSYYCLLQTYVNCVPCLLESFVSIVSMDINMNFSRIQ